MANSVLVTNPDYYDFLIELNQTGVLNYLEQAEAPITVFAFTNTAQEEAVASYNHTIQQADSDPLISSAVYDGKLYSIVREAVPVRAYFNVTFGDGDVVHARNLAPLHKPLPLLGCKKKSSCCLCTAVCLLH